MGRELILSEIYQEANLKKPIDMNQFLSYVKQLIEYEHPGEKVQFLERSDILIGPGDEDHDEKSVFHLKDYLIIFPEELQTFCLATGILSYDMWVPWEDYETELGFENVPFVNKKGVISNQRISMNLLSQSSLQGGIRTQVKSVDNFILYLQSYLNATDKESLKEEDYQLLFQLTINSMRQKNSFFHKEEGNKSAKQKQKTLYSVNL